MKVVILCGGLGSPSARGESCPRATRAALVQWLETANIDAMVDFVAERIGDFFRQGGG
jgi:hypothetical protein